MADVEHVDGGAVVSLAGRLDRAGGAVLRAALHPLCARYDADQVVLDCRRLEELHPTGIDALLASTASFSGGRLTLRRLHPDLAAALDRSGTGEAFRVEVDR